MFNYRYWLIFIIGGMCVDYGHANNLWHKIAPGIEYYEIQKTKISPWSKIHVFKISLKFNRLSLAIATDTSTKTAAVVHDYARLSKAMLAINGGFFDENYRPLGLRIREAHQLSPLRPISWWGIFYVHHGMPHITNIKHFSVNKQIAFAVQSGPRIIIDGHIPRLKSGFAERSSLGITRDHRVILLVTEHVALSTSALAKLMRSAPLNCIQALNLDGGSSSQLYANIDNFTLDVRGLAAISDSIIVLSTPTV
ncbi:MAG: hypothetical protein A3F46_03810 [Legionellales bacterium RIFCSPHIGHO2_12_FULL_42_9]|nr:MAG: hypothetical protein A3F46_03810 [Legionellales bacterium RIFCSPHIGHO2_12_FULL_42_9]